MQDTNVRPDKADSEAKHSQVNPYLPHDNRIETAPDAKLLNSRAKNEQSSLYRSRFNGELPEDRLRKSKSKSIKLRNSNEVKLSLREDVVTVREEKPLLNSAVGGQIVVNGFEDEEFQNKQFKKFSISAMVKERDLIKESNYFDESHEADQYINPVVDKHRADFRIGEFESFETFQVKTYLYDRNLTKKITN